MSRHGLERQGSDRHGSDRQGFDRLRFDRHGWIALVAAALGWKAVLAIVVVLYGRRRRPRDEPQPAPQDVDRLAALLVISLSASQSLASGLKTAADDLGGPVADAVDDLLRRARVGGLARALAETEGELADLAGQLARAQVTGAPMIPAINAFLETRRSAVRARIMEYARTLPIRLIIPVTLLLLPGFILIAFGPFVADQIAALLGGSTP